MMESRTHRRTTLVVKSLSRLKIQNRQKVLQNQCCQSLQLSKFIGIGFQQFCSLNVVPDVNLLILGVSPVVRSSHREEDHVRLDSIHHFCGS